MGELGTSREIVDRSRTRDHADQGVTRKSVVRERRQVPPARELHGSCMRCPEEELGTFVKRTLEADAQPVVSPEKTVGCNLTCMNENESHRFSTNQCESHVKSDLDTIS